jgi:hypothetical protein
MRISQLVKEVHKICACTHQIRWSNSQEFSPLRGTEGMELGPSHELHLRYHPFTHSLQYLDGDQQLDQQQYDRLRTETNLEIFKIILDLGKRQQKLTVLPSKYDSYDELVDKVRFKYQKMRQIQDEIEMKKKQLEDLTTRLKTPNKPSSAEGIDWKDLVLQEERLRMSEEINERYRETERDSSMIDWIEYTSRYIQPRILESNGLEVTPDNLYHLRAAAQETEVFWIKYNRARRGHLRADDLVPSDVVLYDPISAHNSLLPTICQSSARLKPLVFLAGSVS